MQGGKPTSEVKGTQQLFYLSSYPWAYHIQIFDAVDEVDSVWGHVN